ncbi:hypothetical protein EV361DRAFT_804262 [Lentinula raphanica]|uniref:Uncharacterized protein n=1 Tax=Lentinula raphanica TaxID=153919 RepID=A0AA38PIT5_9AGAR|nr:hypothetical protein F5878DRAFT_528132 [Lentinula raphanica]KAJ3969218.1 hypothetical protein EV361DRAFT_804262 [Lentinula raphanica]
MERQYSLNEISRLESNIEQRDSDVEKYSARVVDLEKDIETLRERLSSINREHDRVISERERALQVATEHDKETTEQMKDLLERQGEQNAELRMTKDQVNSLQAEVDRLRRQVHVLQQESADKEVKIVQLSKQHDNAKEDLIQMNMALDSKQQELELLKRRHNVRGTAGSTSNTPAPSRVSRRDSAVFSTPSTSRPSSVISVSSDKESNTVTKERKLSSESIPKISTLAKSTRINGTAASSMGPPSTTKPRLGGITGPRMSMGTPTPVARIPSLSRSNSTKPISASSSTSSGSVAHHRRTSALSGGSGSHAAIKAMPSVPTSAPAPTSTATPAAINLADLQEEKENVDTLHSVDSTPARSDRSDRRRSMIPTPST